MFRIAVAPRVSVATKNQARVASLFLLAQVLKIELPRLNRAGRSLRNPLDRR